MTEKLGRNRRRCDVGYEEEIKVRAETKILHRQGPDRTDAFGCDLAITIYGDDWNFRKTALFQLKLAKSNTVVLEREQMEQTQGHPLTKSRSFVIVANSARETWNVRSTHKLPEFRGKERTVHYNTWSDLSGWSRDWFMCKEGTPSDLHDSQSIERLLAVYPSPEEPELQTEFPRQLFEFFPTPRQWIKFKFERVGKPF